MNRKMNATDLKISTLLRSRMMKWLEFRKLVTKVDRFFYDQKLYELMKKRHSRKINTGDHKFDFYSILLELLYEVHRNDSSEQAKLFERVLEWHRVNQVKLEFTKNVAPRSASAAQLSECKSTMQVNQQKGKESPKGSPNGQKSTVRKTSIIQPHTCTDKNGVCSSATTLKSTQSNQTKVITTPEIVTLKDFPESRNLSEQYSPTDHQRKENFQPLIERTFHTQVSSQEKLTENPFFKRKATLNLGDLINAANATAAPINMSTRKRAQSIPVHQFQTASRATEVNRQQTGVPRSAKGGKIYRDWRGLISPESSGPVVEFQRTLLEKKVLKNRRQKQLVPQSNAQKALSSFLWKSDTTSQRFQETKVVGVSGTNAWRGAAMENTQSESLQRSDPEQVDQSISSLSPFFCHDCQAKFHRGIHCVLCMTRYCKMRGVSSANLPNLCINLSQDANMMLKRKQFDGVGAHRKDSEKTGRSLYNCKKIEITSNVIPDQSEDISIANRGHISTTESSFDGRVSTYQSITRDNKQINETLEFSADFQENGIPTFATTNKEEQHDKIKQEKTSSLIEDESTFQSSQNGEVPTDCLPRNSCDEDFLALITKTGHLSVKLCQGQQIHLSLLKPVDFQECSSSTFDYQQTVQVFQLSVIGHRRDQKPSPKVEAGEICELEKDTVKRPADFKKEPSKTERSVSMYFQPGDRAAKPKATERQKNVSAALGIHDIITRYVSKEYAPETRSIQKEKKEKQLSEHMKWKRQNQLLAEKIRTIYNRPKDVEMKTRHKVLLKERLHHETKRKEKAAAYKQILQNFNALRNRRLEDSRPHDELIDASYPKRTGPSPYRQKMAATFIQKFVRGWLLRITYNRIKIKALGHGKSLSAVVRQYRQMMTRLRRRFDAPWEPIPLVYSDLEDWLDRKKKYEDMFAKREFWKEMNKNELPNFFQDSDHYPSLREINETCALINGGSYNNQPEILTKKQVVELAFTIYPPPGAGLGDRSIYRSTWVRPVVNGEEGFKYILSDHPVLQEAKIEVVGDLVARSMFRRNQMQKFSRNIFTDYLTRAVPMK